MEKRPGKQKADRAEYRLSFEHLPSLLLKPDFLILADRPNERSIQAIPTPRRNSQSIIQYPPSKYASDRSFCSGVSMLRYSMVALFTSKSSALWAGIAIAPDSFCATALVVRIISRILEKITIFFIIVYL